jgi:hypothetical protein
VSCHNGGTCVPLDERSLRYFYACDAEFFGIECENTASKMTILISSNLFSSVSTISAAVVYFGVLKSSMSGIMVHRNQFLFTNLDSKTSKLHLRSITVHRILSGGVEIRCYTVIGFGRLLSGVTRLFTPFSIKIRMPDSLSSGRFHKVGNDQIQLITSGRTPRDPGQFGARNSSESTLLNDT